MGAHAAWAVLGAALLAAGAPSARAQSPDVQLAPSRVVECMTPPVAQRGEPEYPFAPWKRGEGGRVLVEMTFTGAHLEPEVKVLENEGDISLVHAVKAHVARFRTPCAETADLPVRLRQDYVFLPEQRKAVWTTPVDAADAARSRVLKCMAARDGSEHPEYPLWARREEAEGNVLARLRFVAPDRPPELRLYSSSRGTRLLGEHAVQPYVDKLRLPCMEGFAVDALVVFLFRMEGNRPVGFGRMEFLQFLRLAKNLEQPGAVFDTRTMGCPFDLRLSYYQPHLANGIEQRDAPMAARQPLLDWLKTLELDLRPNQQDATLGDYATFTVPCIKMDLTPKEKTP